jgi:tetratricopeptide (TPR) repeat protein
MSDLGNDARKSKSRRRWRWFWASLIASGLILGVRAWWLDRRYKGAMEEIESEIMAGRYAIACRDLDKLLSWKADANGGLVYLLGSCELARGRKQEAAEAWKRVVPGSAFSERAIRGRMRLLQDSGQFSAAERLILDASEDRRNDRTAVLAELVPLFTELGRIEEAERLIEDRWERWNTLGEGASDPAIKMLRVHIDLTLKPAPVETIRTALDRAVRLAPDDDRVWLGRANLAIRTGAYDEAQRWLDDCRRSRPDDVPVWRARLSWSMATNRVDVVQEALKHLPAEGSTPAQVHRLKAWLAAHRGDVSTERQELENLLAIDPTDRTALGRLTWLAEKDGRPDRIAELRRKNAEIDRLQTRFEKLHDRKQPIRDAVEMAHLADQLGRVFEARVFLTLAVSEDPDREDLLRELQRLTPRPGNVDHPKQILAEVLEHEPEPQRKVETPRRTPPLAKRWTPRNPDPSALHSVFIGLSYEPRNDRKTRIVEDPRGVRTALACEGFGRRAPPVSPKAEHRGPIGPREPRTGAVG